MDDIKDRSNNAIDCSTSEDEGKQVNVVKTLKKSNMVKSYDKTTFNFNKTAFN